MEEYLPVEANTSNTPQNVREYHERGWIHLTQNDFAGAEADFRQALAKNNRFAEGFFGLGVALKQLQKYPEAMEAFEKTLSFLGLEAKKEDQIRLSMLRRLAKDHLEILRRRT
jgi:tetratricopeptide (TPR) repeat protein